MADKTTTEVIQLRVLIDGSPARKELAELDQEAAKLTAGLRDMKKGSDEFVAASKRLSEIGARQTELRKEIGLTGLSYRQLSDELRRLQVIQRNTTPNTAMWVENQVQIDAVKKRMAELTNTTIQAQQVWDKMRGTVKLMDMSMEQLEAETRRLNTAMRTLNPRTDEFVKLRAELTSVEQRMAQVRTGMGPFARGWDSIKTSVGGAFAVLGSIGIVTLVTNGLRSMVSGSGELSDSMADIQKVTGKTKEEVEALDQSFRKINTRTANSALREIAVGLGQAGQEVSAAAVGAVDKINVALGDEFGTDTLEISKSLTTLRNNLQDIKSGDYGTDVLHIGNALNTLGAEGLATAPVVTDIANRVAGVATSFGVSSGEILGTAATFQELGINTERGSTAYIKSMQKMIAEPKKFAEVVKAAGGDVDQFLSDINNNAQAAFVTFATSVKLAGKENSTFAGILKELDTDGAGVSELLSKLGQNSELLAEKTKLASAALKDTASITNEFNIKNNTLGANIEKIGKSMAGAFVNSSVVNGINNIVGAIARWTEVKLSETLEQERIEMQKTYAQILSYNEGSKERVKLIEELQAKYPGFLANMAAEKVGNQDLTIAMRALNQELVNKIILQEKDEEIQEQLREQAVLQRAVLDQEDVVRERMVKLAEKYNLTLKEGVSLEAQSIDILEKIREIRRSTNTTGGGVALDPVARFGKAINELRINYSLLNGEQNTSNKLAESRIELMDRLGMREEVDQTKALADQLRAVNAQILDMQRKARLAPDDIAAAGIQRDIDALLAERARIEAAIAAQPKTIIAEAADGTGEDKNADAERQKAAAAFAKFEEELRAHRERMLQINLSSDEADIRQLDVKHAEETRKLRANTLATEADFKALEEAQAQERINLIEQQGERRAKAYADAEKMIADALRDGASQRLKDEAEHWDALIAVAKEKGEGTTELEQGRINALLKIREDELASIIRQEIEKWDKLIAMARANGMDTTALEEAKGRALHAITKKWEDKGVKETEDAELRKRAARVQSMQQFASIASSFGSVLDSIAAMQDEQHMKDGVRSKQEQKEQRELALLIIAVKTAAAIATAVAAAWELGWPAAIPAALASIASIIGMMAQASAILNPGSGTNNTQAQNNAPQGQADSVPLGADGVPALPGRSHSEGGMNIVDPASGRVVYNVEGGEAVVNKDVTAQNPRVMTTALMSAAKRSDKRLYMSDFEGGNGPLTAPLRAVNTAVASSAMQIVHMAGGGVIGNGRNSTIKFTKGQGAADPSGGHENSTVRFQKGQGAADPSGGETNQLLLQLINKVEQQNQLVAQDIATPRMAEVVTTPSMDRSFTRWERLKDNNKLRRA